jgi:hypothetical protein
MLQNRKLFLFASFLCFMLNARAQQTYEKTLNLHFGTDYRITNAIEKENGHLLVAGYGFNGQDYDTVRCFIMELTAGGDSVRGMFLPIQRASWIKSIKILPWTMNRYVIVSILNNKALKDSTTDFKMYVSCYTDSLQLLSNSQLNLNNKHFYTEIGAAVNDKGEIIVCGNEHNWMGTDEYFFLYRCTVAGDSIQYRNFKKEYSPPLSGGYIQFTGNPEQPYLAIGSFFLGSFDFVSFDSILNVTDVHTIDPYYYFFPLCPGWYPASAKYTNGKWYVNGCSCYASHFNGQLTTLVADSAFNYVTDRQYGLNQYVYNYPALYGSLDFKNTSAIFSGGTANALCMDPLVDSIPSWIILNRADENIQTQWTRFYGGDAYYLVSKIIATNDGGCLAFASRYDYHSSDPHQLIYLLKVNADGYVTDTTRSAASGGDAIVHAEGNAINIFSSTSFASPSCFDLKNEKGDIVIEKRLEQPNMQIDASNLPAGKYQYIYYSVERSQEGTIYIKQLPDKQKQFINNEN